MNYLNLPALQPLVENVSLETAKLDKILSESCNRSAAFLDVRYSDGQDVIFLLGGKVVKAGRFFESGREILTATEALEKLRSHKQGSVSLFEISKLLMIIIMGTFIFEPTHGGLKAKLINFKDLLALFERKSFTGYLELKLHQGLHYLTFYSGKPREGYFSEAIKTEDMEFPVRLITSMVETSDEDGEINVYESVGEEELQDRPAEAPAGAQPEAPQASGMMEEEDRAELTAEILDLCLVAIYEDLFRIMQSAVLRELDAAETETLFSQCLADAAKSHPQLFAGVEKREDGTRLPLGALAFDQVLKRKNSLPASQRLNEFIRGLNEASRLRLQAMARRLSRPHWEEALANLTAKIASHKKAYQGNFTIVKVLYDFSLLMEKVRADGNRG